MSWKIKVPGNVVGLTLVTIVFVTVGVIWYDQGSNLVSAENTVPEASNVTDEEFDQRIRTYLLENPEVLVEALQRFEKRQKEAAQSAAKDVLIKRAKEVYRDPDSPVGGNPKGDVTLVEFFDYNCPYCRRVAPTMSAAIAADSQLRVVYKEFPILGPNSMFAAKAALAAQLQGKYNPFHEAIMTQKRPADEQSTIAAAKKIGLDVERLKVDMEDPKITEAIDRNLDLAQELKISGTPAFIIGDQIIPGAVDLKTLQSAINKARKHDGKKQKKKN